VSTTRAFVAPLSSCAPQAVTWPALRPAPRCPGPGSCVARPQLPASEPRRDDVCPPGVHLAGTAGPRTGLDRSPWRPQPGIPGQQLIARWLRPSTQGRRHECRRPFLRRGPPHGDVVGRRVVPGARPRSRGSAPRPPVRASSTPRTPVVRFGPSPPRAAL
jgi:hypothetical protein